MTIRKKVMLPMIAMILVSTIAVLATVIIIFSGYVNDASAAQMATYSGVAQNEMSILSTKATLYSEMLANDPQIVAAAEKKDRQALLKRAAELQGETDVDFTTIMDGSGTVIVRTHDPDNFGDNLSDQINISSAMQGNSLTTLEEGSTVKLSVRAGAPIYSESGRVIGVVSSGYRFDTEEFVDAVKALTGAEVTVFLGDERLSTTVVKDDGTRAVGTTADEKVSSQVLAGNTYAGKAPILGKEAHVQYVPISMYDGTVIGMLFVGQYTSVQTKAIMNFLLQGGIVAAIVLVAAIIITSVLSKRITAPIKTMVKAADSLAEGDVSIQVEVHTKDETSQLAAAFNRMIASTKNQAEALEEIAQGDLCVEVEVRGDKDVMGKAICDMLRRNNATFREISGAARQVQSESHQIASGAQTLAQGSTEQASVVQQLSASMQTIQEKAQDNRDMAAKAASLATNIKQNATTGSEQMDRMTKAVADINEASQKISHVIKVIDDIAFQTNILALNAAVEAARAGQHGKGFAVVAEEVRNLAGKSAEAAKNTGSLIEDSMARAQQGQEIATETAASLSEIVAGIGESEALVSKIAKGSTEQHEAIEQVSAGIEQVAQVVQQNTATAEESAASSEEMSSQSDVLQQLVSQFHLDGIEGR